ncbi:MAG: PSD1 domain-containing protein [Planctomycetaceae bacterium]|nr:PSD1 domain-containing protein [Planctomycetaceae bacterium]
MIRHLFSAIACCFVAASSATSSAATPDFQRDVRPILAKHCLKCHGPDEHGRQGGLRLDLRDAALQPAESGERAIVPGDATAGELLRRVTSTDADERMPPAHSGPPLSAAQIDVLQRWIADGAEYANHWAFEPVRRPAPPEVKNSAWVRNPIDRFVLAKLESAGLAPSPEADRRTLVRRLYLDLIGLPPTPQQADEFVGDPDPAAYEKLVERLLASPHYGERWARRWLDLARYSDTNGYEKDRERSIWPYRDWVVRALNDDLPFDQFTVRQLAGDMLPKATDDDRVATGFHRNTMLNEEGGIDPLEFRYYAMTDRVATTGAVWLGLTLQCAQCHTHKFDPIPHDDYYRFMALLNNADEPEMEVRDAAIAATRGQLENEIARRESRLAEQFPPAIDFTWQAVPAGRIFAARGTIAVSGADGAVATSAARGDDTTTTLVMYGDLADVRGLRMTFLPAADGVAKDPPKANAAPPEPARGVIQDVSIGVVSGATPKPRAVRILRAESDVVRADGGATETFDASLAQAFDGDAATGWTLAVPRDAQAPTPRATFVFAESVKSSGGAFWTITLRHPAGAQPALDRLRLEWGVERPTTRTPAESSAELLARRFQAWLEAATPTAVAWRTVRPAAVDSNLPLLTVQADDSVVSRGDITKSDTYRVRLAGPLKSVRALRLEALPDAGLPAGGPGRIYYEGPLGDFFLSEFTVKCDGRPVKMARASESFSALPEVDPKNPKRLATRAAEAIDGEPSSGWSINGGQGRVQYAVFTFAEPIDAAEALDIEMLFERHYACGLGRFRLAVTAETPAADAGRLPPDVEAALAVEAERRSNAERALLRRHFLGIAPETAAAKRALEALRKRLPSFPTTLVLRERPADEPRPTFVHKRGEYLQPAAQVEPGALSFLKVSDAPAVDRLGLARWLVDARNPLVPRVTVNRHWAALFGKGIVTTLDDFGYQGAVPTHPELLDWLAAEFVTPSDADVPWSVKRLHRLIVESAAYRQSSSISPEAARLDPENALLSRSPRLRLDAEIIRDATLAAAGLLTPKIGGPSVFPPQPASVTEAAYGKFAWKTSTGPDRYRRSLYTFSKRTAPFAMFANFDAPSGELCLPRRDVSNTPLQALNLLNDAMIMEAAEALGKLLAAAAGDDATKLENLFRRILTRPPSAEEARDLLEFYRTERAHLAQAAASPPAAATKGASSAPQVAPEVRAWTLTARALLNVDEAVTRN